MRVSRLVPFLPALLVVFAAPALADEVVYFTNGTSLAITSHKVEKDMISVELGASSHMAFPRYMVDKIESAGHQVYLNPTYHPSNQAVAGNASAGGGASVASAAQDYTVTGEGNVPARYRGGPSSTPGGSSNAVDPSGYVAAGGMAGGPNSADASAGVRVNTATRNLRPMGNRSVSGSLESALAPGVNSYKQSIIPPPATAATTGRSSAVRMEPRAGTTSDAGAQPPTDGSAAGEQSDSPPQTEPPADPPSQD